MDQSAKVSEKPTIGRGSCGPPFPHHQTMSMLQNSFLEAPLKNSLMLYNKEVVPRMTQKNKLISISVAVALSLIYLVQDKVLKPPRNLRHIPYISYWDFIRSAFSNESPWDRAYRVDMPEVDKKNHGIFLEQTRLGWELQVSNPKDAKRVFFKLDIFPKMLPQIEHKDTLNGKFIGGPNLAMINGHEWKAQRKLANPAFSRSMPVNLFGKLTQDMFKMIDALGETVSMSELLNRWTLDAIGKAGFDFNFNSIRDRNSEWYCRYSKINDGLQDPKFFLFPVLDTTLRWMFPERVKLHKEMDIFLNMLDGVIIKKREAIKSGLQNDALDENEKDLLSLLIESEESGEGGLTDEELKSNLCAFFLAGHDTTANALAFAVHYLAQDQDIQQKAREEVIRILGDEKYDVLPTVSQTKEMTYINQIMKETLRINGPAPKVVSRISTEDTELSGTFIPKGTLVNVSIFNIQHSERNWKDGHKFDPERFAEGGEASQAESMAWTPFGNGARQCIGMNFSLAEQRVFLSMLLRKYTWKTSENSIHKNGAIPFGTNITGLRDLYITLQKRY